MLREVSHEIQRQRLTSDLKFDYIRKIDGDIDRFYDELYD